MESKNNLMLIIARRAKRDREAATARGEEKILHNY